MKVIIELLRSYDPVEKRHEKFHKKLHKVLKSKMLKDVNIESKFGVCRLIYDYDEVLDVTTMTSKLNDIFRSFEVPYANLYIR